MMTPVELAKHFRKRLKHEGIQARCRTFSSSGVACIQINVPVFEAQFSDAEQRTIKFIAQCLRMTGVRGVAIDLDRMTNPQNFEFYMGRVEVAA